MWTQIVTLTVYFAIYMLFKNGRTYLNHLLLSFPKQWSISHFYHNQCSIFHLSCCCLHSWFSCSKVEILVLYLDLDDMNFDLDLDLRGSKSKSFCLDNLKELDSDLAQIHLGFQGSKSLDLKYPQKPRNLEISHSHAHCFSLGSPCLSS